MEIPFIWMSWGYPYFRKPPYISIWSFDNTNSMALCGSSQCYKDAFLWVDVSCTSFRDCAQLTQVLHVMNFGAAARSFMWVSFEFRNELSQWIITFVSQYCHFKMERTDDNSLWKLVLGVFSGWHGSDGSDSDPTRIRLGSWGPAIGTRTAGSFDRNQWQIWLKFTPFREGLGRFLSDFWTWIAWIASTWRLKTWGQKGQHAWIILNIKIHNIHDDSDWTHPELPSRWGRWSCSCTTAGTVCC